MSSSAVTNQTIEKWHEAISKKDKSIINQLLHEDCIFYSPVVHTPQKGKMLSYLYLSAASDVLGAGDFKYIKEVIGEHNAVLEFESTIDGIVIDGVDIITIDEKGKIVEFKVMVRPLKAIQKIHEKMAEMLIKMAPK